MALGIEGQIAQGSYSFYPGWDFIHSDWKDTEGLPFSTSSDPFALAQIYFTYWSNPILAFIIFGLFGLTAEARATYWRGICIAASWFGWRLPSLEGGTSSPLETLEFGIQTVETMPQARYDSY